MLMAQVSTQAQLAAAIAESDPNIQIAADFYIDTQQTIRYAALIVSAEGGSYTLTKATGYNGPLFQVQGGGSLTLQNITLDGAQESHSQAGSSLAEAFSGTLILDTGAVLRNNYAHQGGGVAANDNLGSPVTVILQGNAAIRNNRSSNNGGGIYVNYQLPDSSLALSGGSGEITVNLDQATFLDNKAGSGGGLYSAEGTGRITIRGGSQIIGNSATSGGGIYHAGDRVLSLEGATITGNTADTGQGVYNDGPLELGPMAAIPDRLYLPDRNAVPMIVEHFSWDSVVQLERSDYVTPAQDGSSIVVARSNLELVGEDAVVFRTPPAGFAGWRFRVSDDRHQVLLTPAEYTLYYENTLGAENPNPIRYTEYTPTITLLPLENIPGSLFLGWYDAAEGGNQVTQISTGSTGDKTLYAQWQAVEYTVTYYGNDAGGPTAENVPPSQRVRGGESVTLSDERPTRTGYAFIGWNTRPDGGGTAYQPGASFGPAIGDADLYAQWEALPPTIYLLTYEPNDAGGPYAQNIPGQQKISEGETVELSSTIPTRTGYSFLSWNSAPDGSGITYQPGQAVGPFYQHLTICAQWQIIEHSLTYHGNDAGGPPAQWIPFPQPVPYGTIIPLPDVTPTREGYRFTGWNTQPDGGGRAYQPGDLFGPVNTDANLYAQWAVIPPSIHTLTYYGNDVGGSPAQNIPIPVLVPDGQSIILSSVIPIRESFAFTGWNTDPSGTGTIYKPGDTILDVRADVDLYAQWTPLPPPDCYTLTYCGNDAGGPPACCIPCPQQVLADKCARIPYCAPYRTCCCFAGWNTDPCGRGQVYYPGQNIGPITGDVWLYAQWKRSPPPKPCCTCHRVPD